MPLTATFVTVAAHNLVRHSPCSAFPVHGCISLPACLTPSWPEQHFLQRFPPGADRFAGVDTFAAGNGSPALAAAVAHLECTVAARLETPDHWVTYAHVTSGAVADADRKTAVHRRKVANYY